MKLPVSFCMIVKNEEANISEVLASIKDIASEIIIVDTGSTDRTKEICREFNSPPAPLSPGLGASKEGEEDSHPNPLSLREGTRGKNSASSKSPLLPLEPINNSLDRSVVLSALSRVKSGFRGELKLYDYTWTNDFSAARNYLLQFPTQDWIFIIDADHRFNESSKQALSECIHNRQNSLYYVQYREDTNLRHPLITLFRNHIGIKYEGSIHEEVVFDKNKYAIAFSDILITHNSNTLKPFSQEKIQRNKYLLELGLSDPNLPEAKRLRFEIYLFLDELLYNDLSQNDEFQLFLRKTYNISNKIKNSEDIESYKQIFEMFYFESLNILFKNNDKENFYKILMEGLLLFPLSINLLFYLSQLFLISHYYFKAITVLQLIEYLVSTNAPGCYEFNNQEELLSVDFIICNKLLCFSEIGEFGACSYYLEKITEKEKFQPIINEITNSIDSKNDLIATIENDIKQGNVNAFSYFRLAQEYFRSNYDKAKVKELYTKALQLAKAENNVELELMIISNIISKANILNFEQPFLEKLIDLGKDKANNFSFFWYNLGDYHFLKDEYEQAIKSFETAYKSEQGDADLFFNREPYHNKFKPAQFNFFIKQSRNLNYFQKNILAKIKVCLTKLS
jgi:glycosyltransferase involved in cell wall biosynthesis